MTNNILLLL